MSLEEMRSFFASMEGSDIVKLNQTRPVKEFESEKIREMLTYLYESPDSQLKRMGSLLNSAFHHNRQTFMMSRRILGTLISNDKHVDFGFLNYNTYKNLLHRLFVGQYIVLLREPTATKAGIYKIINPTLVKLLYETQNKDFFKAQEDHACKVYDEYEKYHVGEVQNHDDISDEELLKMDFKDLSFTDLERQGRLKQKK